MSKQICLRCPCGWIHFGLTKQNCEESVKKFNDYFDTLSDEDKLLYYGGFKKERDEKGNLVKETDISKVKKASIENYQSCFKCGNSYENFRPATEEELNKIAGSTIQPIMVFEKFKKLKTIDEFCNEPPGTFKKFI
jgi:uncharacterized CHY-type Zn-finger protein